jgi:hypothetical protein
LIRRAIRDILSSVDSGQRPSRRTSWGAALLAGAGKDLGLPQSFADGLVKYGKTQPSQAAVQPAR